MSVTDQHARGSIARETGTAAGRAIICSTVALLEGVAATLTVLSVAVVYHLLVLGSDTDEFAWGFYGIFSLACGSTYAMLSAMACSRFLDSDRLNSDVISSSLVAWTAAIAIALLSAFLGGAVGDVSRVTLTVSYAAGILTLPLLRRIVWDMVASRITSGRLNFERIAIIGRRADVTNFTANGEFWRRGQTVTGVLLAGDHGAEHALDEVTVTEFVRENLRRGANHLVILGDLSDLDRLERLVETVKRFALNVVFAPATQNKRLRFIDVVAIGPNNALRFVRKPIGDGAILAKRAMDLLLSGVGLVVLAPLFLVVAAIIKIDSRGPAFFRQARRGFNGEVFTMWKFRTMSVSESGFDMKPAVIGDPRITRFGRFLRSTSIDELPQLWNVLAGQMSLVGPRPHGVSHDDELSRLLTTYAHRQRIKPGITGWAQVHGYRGETATMDQIEGRVAHDIHYIENWSILLDIWVLILTVISPITHRNAG